MKKLLFSLLFLPLSLFAQDWQQKVDYQMEIALDTLNHQYQGKQKLIYTNNAPDVIRKVYYHLYFNAFQPNSMLAARNRELPDPDQRMIPKVWNLSPEQQGWHKIATLTQNGKPVQWHINDTVMEVALAEPIAAGETSTFEMTWTAQVPLQTRRSGRDSEEGIDFSMSQWYPKMAEYDETGWHAAPYVGREFYAPFGNFDVKLTVPGNLVIGGTGILQNPQEIGHGYVTQNVNSAQKTWHFKAENVHDFAWAADTQYIHKILKTSKNVPIHLFYLPEQAPLWEQLAQAAPRILDLLSSHYGEYPYPQFTILQAGDGGMEYPMAIFITGARNLGGLIGVTVHEGAHQWFYSILGSNEITDAWMDEGFTQYATTEITGKLMNPQAKPSHSSSVLQIGLSRKMGFAEPFSTPSDWFATNRGYSVGSYGGGEALATMLGYIMTDELRDKFFLEYFNRFKFKHPKPRDVQKVAEDVSGLELDWLFHQFLNTTWKLDYAIDGVEKVGTDTEIRFRNFGRAVMPLDVEIKLEDGTSKWVHIPLSIMQGNKTVPNNWLVAEPWQWTRPTYVLKIRNLGAVKSVEIDPQIRMVDENRLNNTYPNFFKMANRAFMKPTAPKPNRYAMSWQLFPNFSSHLGAGIGAQWRGNGLFDDHNLNASISMFSGLGGDYAINNWKDVANLINYDFSYNHAFKPFGQGWRYAIGFDHDLGIAEDHFTLTKTIPANFHRKTVKTLSLMAFHNVRTLNNSQMTVNNSPFSLWSRSNILGGGIKYRLQNGANFVEGSLDMGSTLDASLAQNSALRAQLKAQKQFKLGKSGLLNARLLYGLGSNGLVEQKTFQSGEADLENTWRNDAARLIEGALYGKGADGLRTFSGVGANGQFGNIFKPNHLLQGGISAETNTLFKSALLSPLNFQLFSGFSVSPESGAVFVGDAGVGAQYDFAQVAKLNRWVRQSDVLNGFKVAVKYGYNFTNAFSNKKDFLLYGIQVPF